MKVYFCNSRDQMRLIAECESDAESNPPWDFAMQEIQKFCDEHGFTIHYVRTWKEKRDGVMMTKFDVGSHTEFFYVYCVESEGV